MIEQFKKLLGLAGLLTLGVVPAASAECPDLLRHEFTGLNDGKPLPLCQFQGQLELNRKNELIGKGNAIAERISEIYNNNMEYYLSLKGTPYYKLVDTDMNQALYILQALSGTMKQTNQKELADKIEKRFMEQAQKAGF